MTPLHQQVRIRHGGRTAEVDQQIAPLIRECWRASISTCCSCQDFERRGNVWIVFDSRRSAQRFTQICRVTSETVRPVTVTAEDKAAAIAEGGDPCDHIPVGTILYSWFFRRRDLATVLDRLRRHNKRRSRAA